MSPRDECVLEVSGLSVWYGSAQSVFDVSFSVAEGDIIGLVGRNGAGKTSTIRGIMGLGVRVNGQRRLLGHSLQSLPTYRISRLGLGWVPDDRRMVPTLTVAENLAIARRKGDDMSDSEVISLVPLLSRIMSRKAGVLSGGEQQLVAIARSLVRRPRVLLLDEPCEGLAPTIVEEVVSALRKVSETTGMSLVIAEGQFEVIEALAHRVCALKLGRQVFNDARDKFSAEDKQLVFAP